MDRKNLVSHLIKLYKKEGSTILGSYIDAITDILHRARKDPSLKKLYPAINNSEDWANFIEDSVSQEALNLFREEMEVIEYRKIQAIPRKKLPLHLLDDFQFETNREYFLKRVKGSK